MFSTISPVRSGNFNFSDNMPWGDFFKTLLLLLSDSCYNLKLADLQLFSDWLIYVKNTFFQDTSTGVIWLMLTFKMADLQLFSNWLKFIFHYSPVRSGNFNFSKLYVINILFRDASTGASKYARDLSSTDQMLC